MFLQGRVAIDNGEMLRFEYLLTALEFACLVELSIKSFITTRLRVFRMLYMYSSWLECNFHIYFKIRNHIKYYLDFSGHF